MACMLPCAGLDHLSAGTRVNVTYLVGADMADSVRETWMWPSPTHNSALKPLPTVPVGLDVCSRSKVESVSGGTRACTGLCKHGEHGFGVMSSSLERGWCAQGEVEEYMRRLKAVNVDEVLVLGLSMARSQLRHACSVLVMHSRVPKRWRPTVANRRALRHAAGAPHLSTSRHKPGALSTR